MKINKNPAIAYIQGKEEGKSIGTQNGFFAMGYISLLGLYNANAELELLTEEEFKNLFIEMEKEVNRIFTEEYNKNPDDIAAIAMYHVNELREKIGLKKI